MCVSMNVYGLRSTILSLFTDFSIGQVKATIQASVVHITYITKKKNSNTSMWLLWNKRIEKRDNVSYFLYRKWG